MPEYLQEYWCPDCKQWIEPKRSVLYNGGGTIEKVLLDCPNEWTQPYTAHLLKLADRGVIAENRMYGSRFWVDGVLKYETWNGSEEDARIAGIGLALSGSKEKE